MLDHLNSLIVEHFRFYGFSEAARVIEKELSSSAPRKREDNSKLESTHSIYLLSFDSFQFQWNSASKWP